jgi:5-carboxymethyl-2-hydroxymuconate isomerase
MPNITVLVTDDLTEREAVDFDGLAPELQSTVVAVTGARPEACQVRFVLTGAWYIADGTEDTHQGMHVEVALKAGRSAEVKRTLSQSVLALVRRHLAPTPEVEVHLSVEVRDIDPDGYASHVEPAQDVPEDAVPQGA